MQKSLTSNPAQRPRQPRKPKAEHLCMTYPDLPETDHPAFWLAAYLRDLAETSALDQLCKRSHASRGPGTDNITQLALYGARTSKRDETRASAARTQDAGMLLYAWPGTKFFDSAKPQ
ncbi:hypothetical protein [Delftia sp. PS-11]|uniref:hypothetical protein n=1 Tax=Delftia sp. PS-11 TaxID=2767222 RepID=UPI002453C17D|nr:hypothetical protein [Delftia sp. PS-11]